MNALRDFSECAAFLAEVYDETDSTTLRPTDTLLNCVGQVGFACADIRAEHVRTIAYEYG